MVEGRRLDRAEAEPAHTLGPLEDAHQIGRGVGAASGEGRAAVEDDASVGVSEHEMVAAGLQGDGAGEGATVPTVHRQHGPFQAGTGVVEVDQRALHPGAGLPGTREDEVGLAHGAEGGLGDLGAFGEGDGAGTGEVVGLVGRDGPVAVEIGVREAPGECLEQVVGVDAVAQAVGLAGRAARCGRVEVGLAGAHLRLARAEGPGGGLVLERGSLGSGSHDGLAITPEAGVHDQGLALGRELAHVGLERLQVEGGALQVARPAVPHQQEAPPDLAVANPGAVTGEVDHHLVLSTEILAGLGQGAHHRCPRGCLGASQHQDIVEAAARLVAEDLGEGVGVGHGVLQRRKGGVVVGVDADEDGLSPGGQGLGEGIGGGGRGLHAAIPPVDHRVVTQVSAGRCPSGRRTGAQQAGQDPAQGCPGPWCRWPAPGPHSAQVKVSASVTQAVSGCLGSAGGRAHKKAW